MVLSNILAATQIIVTMVDQKQWLKLMGTMYQGNHLQDQREDMELHYRLQGNYLSLMKCNVLMFLLYKTEVKKKQTQKLRSPPMNLNAVEGFM